MGPESEGRGRKNITQKRTGLDQEERVGELVACDLWRRTDKHLVLERVGDPEHRPGKPMAGRPAVEASLEGQRYIRGSLKYFTVDTG